MKNNFLLNALACFCLTVVIICLDSRFVVKECRELLGNQTLTLLNVQYAKHVLDFFVERIIVVHVEISFASHVFQERFLVLDMLNLK